MATFSFSLQSTTANWSFAQTQHVVVIPMNAWSL